MIILVILGVLFVGWLMLALVGSLMQMNWGGWLYLGICVAIFFVYVVK